MMRKKIKREKKKKKKGNGNGEIRDFARVETRLGTAGASWVARSCRDLFSGSGGAADA